MPETRTERLSSVRVLKRPAGRGRRCLQDVSRFFDNVEENIRMGNNSASLDSVVSAAGAARIHDFIETPLQGCSTLIGEGRICLSGGEQRQSPSPGRFSRMRRWFRSMRPQSLWTPNRTGVYQLRRRLFGASCVLTIHRLAGERCEDRRRLSIADNDRLSLYPVADRSVDWPGADYRGDFQGEGHRAGGADDSKGAGAR